MEGGEDGGRGGIEGEEEVEDKEGEPGVGVVAESGHMRRSRFGLGLRTFFSKLKRSAWLDNKLTWPQSELLGLNK